MLKKQYIDKCRDRADERKKKAVTLRVCSAQQLKRAHRPAREIQSLMKLVSPTENWSQALWGQYNVKVNIKVWSLPP